MCMLLPKPDLEEFIKHYENAFNEHITSEEATVLYLRLINLYRSLKGACQENCMNIEPNTLAIED